MLEKPGPQPWAPDIQSRALQFLKGETETGNALAGLVFRVAENAKKVGGAGRRWGRTQQSLVVGQENQERPGVRVTDQGIPFLGNQKILSGSRTLKKGNEVEDV